MRVAICKQGSRQWDKYAWVADGFRAAGHEVRTAGEYTGCMEAEQWADVSIWQPAVLSAMLPPRQADAFRVAWQFDLIAMEPDKPLGEQSTLVTWDTDNRYTPAPMLMGYRLCNLVLVKERSLLEDYRAIGVEAEWFDQGFPGHIGVTKHAERPRWDILILGGLQWRQRRVDAAALVVSGLRVAWAANPCRDTMPHGIEALPWCPPNELPGLVRDAAVVLDCSYRSDLDGYWSDKFWLLLGMGACHVRRWSPGLPKPRGKPAPYSTYRTHEEMFSVVKSLLADTESRRRMGAAARDWVLGRHTYTHRAGELIELCEKKETYAAVAEAAR